MEITSIICMMVIFTTHTVTMSMSTQLKSQLKTLTPVRQTTAAEAMKPGMYMDQVAGTKRYPTVIISITSSMAIYITRTVITAMTMASLSLLSLRKVPFSHAGQGLC